MRLAIPLLAILALTACMLPVPGSYTEVLPDERVKINLPVDPAAVEREKDWSEYYLLTARVTDDVNGLIGMILLVLDEVTALPPTWSDAEESTAVWGPFSDPLDPVETALWVHHDVDEDVFTWGVDLRPTEQAGTDEGWVAVVAGQVDPGATGDESSGYFGIDFDLASRLDPTSDATGRFGCEYDVGPDGVQATAGFEDFSDGGDPVTAYYAYEQDYEGLGRMDLALEQDVNPENGLGTLETHLMRSRWTPTGAGRADVYVTGGDLGPLVATASECWDETFEWVYQVDNCSGEAEEGDVADCVFASPEYDEDGGPAEVR